MKLVLTLLCRDEADILESMLGFHLEQGVDQIIATDNGSVDGSLEILQRFEGRGQLTLLEEAEHTHDQAIWVSRMARMAASMGADWVINSDADEFWCSNKGNLKNVFETIPKHVDALSVKRSNYLPPLRNPNHHKRKHRVSTLREQHSKTSEGLPLPPKVCHRGDPHVQIGDGNHRVSSNNKTWTVEPSQEITILHYPVRNLNQLERKIRQGTEALRRNQRVGPGVGKSWKEIYDNHLSQGNLAVYYDGLRPSAEDIQNRLANGELIRDRRLQKIFQKHQ